MLREPQTDKIMNRMAGTKHPAAVLLQACG